MREMALAEDLRAATKLPFLEFRVPVAEDDWRRGCESLGFRTGRKATVVPLASRQWCLPVQHSLRVECNHNCAPHNEKIDWVFQKVSRLRGTMDCVRRMPI